jgi:hypothetical protein
VGQFDYKVIHSTTAAIDKARMAIVAANTVTAVATQFRMRSRRAPKRIAWGIVGLQRWPSDKFSPRPFHSNTKNRLTEYFRSEIFLSLTPRGAVYGKTLPILPDAKSMKSGLSHIAVAQHASVPGIETGGIHETRCSLPAGLDR